MSKKQSTLFPNLAIKVYVTGDGPCPWCGKVVVAEKVETHHIHFVVPKGKLKEAIRERE